MLKPIYVLFVMSFMTLVFSCQNSAEKPVEKIQHFTSGEVSRRHYEINGKKEGVMVDYYPGGKVHSERLFVNDRQTGRMVFYYPSGKLKEVQYFDNNGLKDNGDSIFYEDGQLQMVLNFKDGKKDGYLRKYAEGGTLIFEAKYEQDTLVEVKGEKVNKK